ncbi:MAG: phosphoribosylformylglycinamidine synthase subunit PurQ [Candidatus Altiarchaeales archaeon]|nr:MAG: phosphoribosylformylglycinamidine synthase subunit PurQ [Candidatus Altiarchaeales archaeon]RLI94367.1 MAG: phosphoribosylformylglycinamidine synthase subunit PurQ [Candidatus Altiarchaeales archaeon]HDO81990.1 phosphoribosylformylglycinamidine synthase subunit PurQ [Candidatus Altiarchaeales archaeon]HEX54639.1 phosphoribosylformylglycinamidine synthase subunit PurQ [Candidatus Altiarchaeales archaeon]
MKDIRACILIIEGTNCEFETKLAFESVGISAEIVHLKQLIGNVPRERRRDLLDYRILVFPGGWSAGDYVRAGAIFAARIKSKLIDKIEKFVESGNLVLGICNGFQILTELGALPGFDGISEKPEVALTTNLNAKFQCRAIYLKHENKCKFTERIPEGRVLQFPVAHAEGRFTLGENERLLDRLIENGQIVFRYCREDGGEADGEFPFNPNGSLYDIAGICNPDGNVLGMMPHPERVISKIQMADWTRNNYREGDGRIFFESIREYVRNM